MADSISAIKWINNYRTQYDIRVRENCWTKDFLQFPFFDYEITLTVDGIQHVGRGFDSAESLAVVKALAESIERLTCWESRINTSGVAAHFCQRNAFALARRELIEHDWYFFHRISRSRPAGECLVGFEHYTDAFCKRGLRFQAFPLGRTADIRAVMVLSLFEEEVISLGLGAAQNVVEATQKALLESLPNSAQFLFNGRFKRRGLKSWLSQSAVIPTNSLSMERVQFREEMLACSVKSPFKVGRVLSLDLQGYLGKSWNHGDISAARFPELSFSSLAPNPGDILL